MLHALVRIGREEGLKALYSGIAPAMSRQASYDSIKIGVYQSLKRLFVERPEDETLLINVICGILSGVISSTIANPTDALKIRMQAQNSTLQGGMIGNFIHIYQQEGTRGLWKGVSLTAQRAAIVVGVELPVYDLTKKHLILSGLMGDTVYNHFCSGFTCGLAGALASNPVNMGTQRKRKMKVVARWSRDIQQGKSGDEKEPTKESWSCTPGERQDRQLEKRMALSPQSGRANISLAISQTDLMSFLMMGKFW
ncbi:hypothetical protein EI555_019369 [Monodon monoceros]|uniref:Kidney mitochondrial carrier protein 1 n=1 Tax=Monodon monoceros TaxID=40151 RepID=A0A4U1FIC7_MONMO|nr:hypothetical protein EI555_019369 [Monodon monoceros]